MFKFVDIYSRKIPIVLIFVLVGILVLQFVTNNNDGATLIDSQTCELYIEDAAINAKKYLGEYDEKCLEFKSLNP